MKEELSLKEKIWPYLLVIGLDCLLPLGGGFFLSINKWLGYEETGLFFALMLFPAVLLVVSSMSAWCRERFSWQIPVAFGGLGGLCSMGAVLLTAILVKSAGDSALSEELMSTGILFSLCVAGAAGGFSALLQWFFHKARQKHIDSSAWTGYVVMGLTVFLLRSFGTYFGTAGMIICSLLEIAICVVTAWFQFRQELESSLYPAIWALICAGPALLFSADALTTNILPALAQSAALVLALALASNIYTWRAQREEQAQERKSLSGKKSANRKDPKK